MEGGFITFVIDEFASLCIRVLLWISPILGSWRQRNKKGRHQPALGT
jgi:hypothetical protein